MLKKNLPVAGALVALLVLIGVAVFSIGVPASADPADTDAAFARLTAIDDRLAKSDEAAEAAEKNFAALKEAVGNNADLFAQLQVEVDGLTENLSRIVEEAGEKSLDAASLLIELDDLRRQTEAFALRVEKVEFDASNGGDGHEHGELKKKVDDNRRLINRNSELVIDHHVAANPYPGHRQEHLLSVD